MFKSIQKVFYSYFPTPQMRLDRAHDMVLQTPEGRALFALAQELGFTMALDPSLTAVPGRGVTRMHRRKIGVNPRLKTDDMAKIICHELRHVWQYAQDRQVGELSEMTVGQALGTQRLMEGDAFVFESYMAKRLSQVLGRTIAAPSLDAPSVTVNGFCEDADPFTAKGQRVLFNRFQSSRNAKNYDEILLDKARNIAQLQGLSAVFNGTAAPPQTRLTVIAGGDYMAENNENLIAQLELQARSSLKRSLRRLAASL